MTDSRAELGSFLAPVEETSVELRERGSRFLGVLLPAAGEEAATTERLELPLRDGSGDVLSALLFRPANESQMLVGLVHGLGFSFVLHEILKLCSPNLWQSLIAFNVGVEIGQLGIVLLVWPLFWYLAKRGDDVAILPERDQLEADLTSPRPQRHWRAACEQLALSCLDLRPAFVASGRGDALFRDLQHLAEPGSRLAAKEVADRLLAPTP